MKPVFFKRNRGGFGHVRVAGAAALLAGTLLASAAGAKTIVWCSEASPEGFDPGFYTASTTFDATGHNVYNMLVEFEPGTTNPIPAAAESWTISNDGKEYTFKLRKGVKFHTTDFFTPTREMNADDVIFSFGRQIDKQNPWNHYVAGAGYDYGDAMGFPKLIKSIEKVDDLTVKFHLSRPEAPFPADIAIESFAILSKEYADKLRAEGRMAQLNQKPVGTGPFVFVDYRQDSVIRYKANADYWRGRPKIDNLVFAITPDATVRYQKLKAGECHMMPFPNFADIAAIEADPDLKVKGNPALNIGYLAYNTTQPPFDKPEVRKALNMAVNKRAIIDAVFQGKAQPAKNPIPPGMWSYNDDTKSDEYNLDKARKMLEKAGVKNLSMKVWAMPVARPYMLNARRAAEVIQADFAKIGVKVEIVTYEWGEYIKRAANPKHDGAIILGWTSDNGDPDNFIGTLLSCDSVGTSNNPAAFCNAEFDELVKKAKVVSDKAERARFYKQAQVVFKREAPWATIDHSLEFVPMRREVVGFVESPMGRHDFETVDLVQ